MPTATIRSTTITAVGGPSYFLVPQDSPDLTTDLTHAIAFVVIPKAPSNFVHAVFIKLPTSTEFRQGIDHNRFEELGGPD